MSVPTESKTYLAIPVHDLPVAIAFNDIMAERLYKAPVETIREEFARRLNRDPSRIVTESQKENLRTQKSQHWAFYEIINNKVDSSPF